MTLIANPALGGLSRILAFRDADLGLDTDDHSLYLSGKGDGGAASDDTGAQDGEDADSGLKGRRVLVVEDEAMLALDMEFGLGDAGADVIGPALTLQNAIDLIEQQASNIAAAVLDVDLGGVEVFPAADRLHALGVPIVFQTGHADPAVLQERYGDAPVLMKPTTMERLIETLARTLHTRKH